MAKLSCPSCGAGQGEWHKEGCASGGFPFQVFMPPDEPSLNDLTVAQWARAQGFQASATLYNASRGTVRAEEVELLALRWAKIIETGERP